MKNGTKFKDEEWYKPLYRKAASNAGGLFFRDEIALQKEKMMSDPMEPVTYIKHAIWKTKALGREMAMGLIIEMLDEAVLKKHDHAFVRQHTFDCWNRAEQIVREWDGSKPLPEMPRELSDLMTRHFRETLHEYLKSLDKYTEENDI